MVPRDSHVSWLSCSLRGNNIGDEMKRLLKEDKRVEM